MDKTTIKRIYIIAGEASGDIYGARLIEALRRISPEAVEFYGVGGDKMSAAGLSSLFPMSEISIMGFLEIIPHIPNTLRRIRQTVEHIKAIRPNVVITIDSPGFCCRVAKQLRNNDDRIGLFQRISRSARQVGRKRILDTCVLTSSQQDNLTQRNKPIMVHYVAPTVWAYKPKRAQKFARLFDHLLVILPFEPPYFQKVGLPCTYIGHPITESMITTGKPEDFCQKYNIVPGDTLICLMPGSRTMEVTRLLPTFLTAIRLLPNAKNFRIVIPTIPAVRATVENLLSTFPIPAIILDNEAEKYSAYSASKAAIVKSGTGSLEVAMAGCPMVIAYKLNPISYGIIKLLLRIKYASLINIILNKEHIPELIQNKCQPGIIAQKLNSLLTSESLRKMQINENMAVMNTLGYRQIIKPSDIAAQTVLALIKN